MKATRLSKLLNIQQPIIQAGMPWVSNAELAATVSNAGALGLITLDAGLPAGGDILENYYTQLRKLRTLTSKPYGVNLYLDHPLIKTIINITVEQAVPVVVTGGGSPDPQTGHLKDAGITLLPIVSTIHEARAAEARGADAIIAQGCDAGGRVSHHGTSTLSLVPQVVDAVEIPVIASGGIVDGRGLAAALSLGAVGAYVGTRFIATHECIAHPNLKKAIINAIDTSTIILNQRYPGVRVLRNKLTESLGSRPPGSDPQELEELLSEERARIAMLEGRIDEGLAYCGTGAGLITEIISAAEVVKRMTQEADAALGRIK